METIDVLKKFSELENQKIKLTAELAAVQNELTDLNPHVVEAMLEQGIDQIKILGRTIYTKDLTYAVIKDKEAVPMALIEAGMKDYIKETANTNSISAYVRECRAQGIELPASFRGVIEAGSRRVAQSRAA